MKLTAQDKVDILTETLQVLIKSEEYTECICLIIHQILLLNYKTNAYSLSVRSIQEEFNLFQFKPVGESIFNSWWTQDYPGHRARIRVVTTLIREYEKEATEKG